MSIHFGTATPQADPIAWLKHDHQIIRSHLEQLNSPEAARTQTLESLKSLLALHNAIEENLVYPAIANVAGDQAEAMQLFHETAEADILLDALSRAATDENGRTFGESLRQLTAGIEAHIQEEETTAFPLLESAPAAELHLLSQKIQSFKATLNS
jgi:iron-sulfur cluster repair protein YtfE (RIC family)